MTSRYAAAALLLAALAACASAGRVSSGWERLDGLRNNDPQAFRWLSRATNTLTKKGKDEKEHLAIVGIKYDVPPSMHEEFVKAWRKLEDKTQEEKGLNVYDLKKTMGDNVYFWTYGEWDSMEDYLEHFKADYTEDFLDFLNDKDIPWTLYPLKNMTDTARESKAAREGDFGKKGGKGKGGDDPRDMNAHVIFQYHVPPSMVEEFVDRWNDAAEKTWDKEDDNTIFALRKIATMNHHFLGYGTWESYDAYLDHFTSGHVRKLREWMNDNDIMWFAEALKKEGDQPEE